MTDREDAMDQVAALALGILPAKEGRGVRMRIALDEDLFAEYHALRTTADLIGFAAEAEPAEINELQRVRMKSQVMKAVRAQAIRTAPMPTSRAGFAGPAYAVAAAALVAAFIATLDNVSMRRDLTAQQHATAALQQQVSAQSKLATSERTQIADLFAPDSVHYPVAGGEVVTRGGRVYVAMRSLPKLPAGKVFQVWTLAHGAKTVAPSITFTPNTSGSAIVRVPAEHQLPAAVAISIEPKGGSKAPTSKPTFIRPLS